MTKPSPSPVDTETVERMLGKILFRTQKHLIRVRVNLDTSIDVFVNKVDKDVELLPMGYVTGHTTLHVD